jgi:hypothetical protein
LPEPATPVEIGLTLDAEPGGELDEPPAHPASVTENATENLTEKATENRMRVLRIISR